MPYDVSFSNYTPPPLFDDPDLHFQFVVVEEAAGPQGPWAVVDTLELVPLDSDPTEPAARSFTTHAATLERGWYRIYFLDENGGQTPPTDPEYNSSSAGTPYSPGLATPADVRRVAGGRLTSTDEEILAALETAESYLRTRLPAYDATNGTETYFTVSSGDPIRLPFPGAAVTAIRTYDYQGSTARSLAPSTYRTDSGLLRLLQPNAIPIGEPSDRWLYLVEVDWTNPSGVPAAVRDGVALTAASLISQFPRIFGGMRSERIGDYSYTLADKDVDVVVPPKAEELLRPFLKRRNSGGVFVT